MREKPPGIHFETGLIEEAVFLAMHQLSQEGRAREQVTAFYEERDRIYTLPDAGRKEASFQDFYQRHFSEIGFRNFVEKIYREFPLLIPLDQAAWVRRVLNRKQEGSELYVEGPQRTLVVKIQAARYLDLNYLERFLRHELMHISDMLDPGFQYSPNHPLGGRSELEDNLIRGRFRLLWDLYVSARIQERGKDPLIPLDLLERSFQRAFSPWRPDERTRILRNVHEKRSWTQAGLLELCGDRRLEAPLGRGGTLCPLCGFTASLPAALPSGEAQAVLVEIQRDFPDWAPPLGICRQCCDLYQSKVRAVS